MSQEVYEMTELGNAQMYSFITNGNMLKIREAADEWILWNGEKWVNCEGSEMMKYYQSIVDYYAAKVAEAAIAIAEIEKNENHTVENTKEYRAHKAAKAIMKAISSWHKKCQSKAVYVNTLALFCTLEGSVISLSDMDSNSELVGVKNGVLDLRSGKMLDEETAKAALITLSCNVEYNPKASSKEWVKLINKLMVGNRDKILYLQLLLGSALTGINSPHFSFFLGGGSNGKTTLFAIMAKVLGEYSAIGDPDMFKPNTKANPEYHYATWRGKRMLTFNETDRRQLAMSEAMIKRTTDSEAVTARHPRGRVFDYLPQFTPIFSVNHMPDMGTDEAVWRRVGVLSFDYTITENTKEVNFYDNFFKANGAGILNWLLQGAVAFIQEGIFVPDDVKRVTKKIKDDSNEVLLFLKTLTDAYSFTTSKFKNDDTIVSNKIKNTDLLAGFNEYCSTRSLGRKPGHKVFATDLRQLGLEVKTSTGNAQWVFGLEDWLVREGRIVENVKEHSDEGEKNVIRFPNI